MGVYEDNFGFWDIDGPDERALFEHVQRQSVYITASVANVPSASFRPKPFAPHASAPSNAAHRLR
jgi:hypothetical protein